MSGQTDEEATKILEWESTDGSIKSLIYVTDHSKTHWDVDYKRFEIAVFDSEEEEWKTEEEVDFVEGILDFGIPQELVD